MIPYDLDPSLHSAQPLPPQLDDGFSPPRQEDGEEKRMRSDSPLDPAFAAKSEF